MIELTRLNGTPIVLNSDLIKTAEASPDTMLTLINGEKLIVREDLRRGDGAGARLSCAPAGRRGPAHAVTSDDLQRVVSITSLDVAGRSSMQGSTAAAATEAIGAMKLKLMSELASQELA